MQNIFKPSNKDNKIKSVEAVLMSLSLTDPVLWFLNLNVYFPLGYRDAQLTHLFKVPMRKEFRHYLLEPIFFETILQCHQKCHECFILVLRHSKVQKQPLGGMMSKRYS